MKGVIINCLEEMVKEKFGNDKWESALERAGLNKRTRFLPISNIDDNKAMASFIACSGFIICRVCEKLILLLFSLQNRKEENIEKCKSVSHIFATAKDL